MRWRRGRIESTFLRGKRSESVRVPKSGEEEKDACSPGSEAAAAPPPSASVPTLPCSRRLRRSSRARSVALWTRSGGKVAAEEGGWVADESGGGPVAATAFGATGRAEDDEEVLMCPGGELDSPMQLRARDTKTRSRDESKPKRQKSASQNGVRARVRAPSVACPSATKMLSVAPKLLGPVKLGVSLPERLNPSLVLPEVEPARFPPLARLQLQHASNNFGREPPGKRSTHQNARVKKKSVKAERKHSPRELASALLA